MMAGELLAEKLQTILGQKYRIFSDDAFNDNFTTSTTGVFGNVLAFEKHAFEEYKDIIVGVVKLVRPFRANVDFYSLSADYEVVFWVPVDFVRRDRFGKVLDEHQPFDFHADMEKLLGKVVNQNIKFSEGKRGRMSMTEPYGLGTKESTASGMRKAMQISGRLFVTDKGLFGGDVKHYLQIDGEWVELEGVNTIDSQTATDGSLLVKSGDIKSETEMGQQGYSLTLGFDDFATTNTAINYLKGLVRLNQVARGKSDDLKTKGKVFVRTIYPDSGGKYDFWAIPEITFSSARNEVGRYVVNFFDDNRSEDGV